MLIEDVFTEIYTQRITFDKITNPTEDQIFNLIQLLQIKSYNFMLVIDELLINSQEHGGAPIEFYYGEALDSLFFAITDLGSGIHVTLPRNIKLSDIKDKASTAIIRIAMEEGITGTSTVGRGMGLAILSKFIIEKNADAIIDINFGMLKQMGSYFLEKKPSFEIQGNCVIIKIHKKELGL